MSESTSPEFSSGVQPSPENPSDFVAKLLDGIDIAGELTLYTEAYEAAMERIDPGGVQAERDRLCQEDISSLCDKIDQNQGDTGLPDELLATLEEYNFIYERKFEASPMFPEGRDGSLNIREVLRRNNGKFPEKYWDNTRSGNVLLPDKVLSFIITVEMLHPEEFSDPSSHTEFLPNPELYNRSYDDLRCEFGAKAAGLIVFDAALRGNKSFTHDAFNRGPMIEVPPFIPVSKQLHALWRTDYEAFVEECEKVRSGALQLPENDWLINRTWLVAVRSSAVKSEDGDEHSAAGIYHSGVADIRDQETFRSVVEEVFASTTSTNALQYQEDMGVIDEEMGLVIQLYSEDFISSSEFDDEIGARNGHYGHANYTLGNRAIDVQIMGAGSLLYDADTRGNLQFQPWPSFYELHTDPDHYSPENFARRNVGAIPYAVALATFIFGKPMEVEFHNNKILQVRPYILSNPTEVVTFPDKPALTTTRSVGVINEVLPFLDGNSDNQERTGYIVIEEEFCFTAKGNYKGFPKKGAVILLQPHDGHVQAFCRERGLACLYPRKHHYSDKLLDAIQIYDDEYEAHPKSALHIVSDGFEARIFDIAIDKDHV